MKKIASIFMAVAMVLALSVPAFASGSTITGTTTSGDSVEPPDSPYSSDFKGEYQETIIDIELPNNVALVFNPYRLEYSATTNSHSTESGDDVVLVDKLADQIFSAPVTIVSKSNIQLDVDMEFTVTKGSSSDIEFAASAAGYTSAIATEGQNVLLQMVYGIVGSTNADPSDSDAPKTITLSESTTLTDLLSADGAEGQTDLTVTIPAGNSTPQYFGYKFTGKAQTNTAAAGDDPNPYNSEDTIDVGIAFTFLPVANPDNQVQGGTFTYNAFAADGTTAIDVVANIGSDADDVSAVVPDGQEGTELPSGKAWTLTKVKVNGADVASTDIANTLTFDTDAKTLTLKKKTVWDARDTTGVTAGKKYVKVIPVEFTATSDESTPQEVKINCNVRIVYDPQKAAS